MDPNEIPTPPFWREVEPTGRMLRMAEVVRLVGLSRSQIYAMMAEGRFPPFVKLSERASALPEAWLNAFVSNRASRLYPVSNSTVKGDGQCQ